MSGRPAMASILERLKGSIHTQTEKHRNRPFLEATMAAAALVACADGTVSLSERVRIDQILERLDQLRVYDPHLGVDLFNQVADALAGDPGEGRALAFERIARVAGDPEAVRLMVRICCAVSEADGEFSPAERQMIEEICAELEVKLEDCLA